MTISKIIEILRCPLTNEPLLLNSTNSKLTNLSGTVSYNIEHNIPVILKEVSLKNQFNYIQHYQKDAESFDYFEERTGATKDDERRVAQMILKHIPKNIENILDVGCGKGWIAKHFINSKSTIISLDLSLTNVKKVNELYPAENHIGIVADAYHLPFQNNSLECIVASETIEHLQYPQKFLSEAYRCLKNSANLIITTPYKEKIKYSLCIHCNTPTPHNAHLHSFDEEILENLFQQAGFNNFYYKRFGNKALLHLRTYVITKFLPFPLWQLIDNISNLILPKQAHILCIAKK